MCVERTVLIPSRGEPISSQGHRQRTTHDEAEVSRARRGYDRARSELRELLDDLQRIGAGVVKSSADFSQQLRELNAARHGPVGNSIEEVVCQLTGSGEQFRAMVLLMIVIRVRHALPQKITRAPSAERTTEIWSAPAERSGDGALDGPARIRLKLIQSGVAPD